MEEEKIKDPEDNNDGIPDFKFNAQTENNDKKNEFLSPVDKAELFTNYLKENGLEMAFQVICNEIIEKKIQHDNVFAYTAMRLRQFGHDLSTIKKLNFPKQSRNSYFKSLDEAVPYQSFETDEAASPAARRSKVYNEAIADLYDHNKIKPAFIPRDNSLSKFCLLDPKDFYYEINRLQESSRKNTLLTNYLKWHLNSSDSSFFNKNVEKEVTFIFKMMEISQDGSKLISVGQNNFVICEDISTNSQPFNTIRSYSNVISLAVSPLNTSIAVGFQDEFVHVYDLLSGKILNNIEHIICNQMKFSYSGSFLGCVQEGFLFVYNLNETEPYPPIFKFAFRKIIDFDFSHDGEKVCICEEEENEIKIYDLFTSSLIKSFSIAGSRISGLKFSYGDNLVALETENLETNKYKVILWDLNLNKSRISSAKFHKSSHFSNFVFSDDDQFLAYASGNSLFMWSIRDEGLIFYSTLHEANIEKVNFLLDTNKIICVSKNRMITIVDTTNGRIIKQTPNCEFPDINEEDPVPIIFSLDGAVVAAVNDKTRKKISLWSCETRKLLVSKEIPNDDDYYVEKLTFSKCQHFLASANSNFSITIWSASNLQILGNLHGHTAKITSLDFGTKKQLITGSNNNIAYLWDINTMKKVKDFKVRGSITALKLSPKSDLVVIAFAERNSKAVDIYVFDIELEKNFVHEETFPLAEPITSIDFNETGEFYAYCSKNFYGINEVTSTHEIKVFQKGETNLEYNLVQFENRSLYLISQTTGLVEKKECDKSINYPFNLNSTNMKSINYIKSTYDNKGKYYSQGCVATYKHGVNLIRKYYKDQILDVSSSGKLIASLYSENVIKIYDRTNEKEMTLQTLMIKVASFRFLKDENACIISGTHPQKNLLKYNLKENAFDLFYADHTNDVTCFDINDIESQMVSCGEDKRINLWDVQQGKLIKRINLDFAEQQDVMTVVSFSENYQFLALASRNYFLYIYNLDSETLVTKGQLSDQELVNCLMFGNNDTHIFISYKHQPNIKYFARDSLLPLGHVQASNFCFFENYLVTAEKNKDSGKWMINIRNFLFQKYNVMTAMTVQAVKRRNRTIETEYNENEQGVNIFNLDRKEKLQKLMIKNEHLFIICKKSFYILEIFIENDVLFKKATYLIPAIYSSHENMLKEFPLELFRDVLYGKQLMVPFKFNCLQIISYMQSTEKFKILSEYNLKNEGIIPFSCFIDKSCLGESALDIAFKLKNKLILEIYFEYFLQNYSLKEERGITQKEALSYFNSIFYYKLITIFNQDTAFITRFFQFTYINQFIPDFYYDKLEKPLEVALPEDRILNEQDAIQVLEERNENCWNQDCLAFRSHANNNQQKPDPTIKISVDCLLSSDLANINYASTSFLKKVTTLNQQNPLFEDPIFKKLLIFKWNQYGKKVFWKEFLVFFLFFLFYIYNAVYIFPFRYHNLLNILESEDDNLTYKTEFNPSFFIYFERVDYFTMSITLNLLVVLFIIHHIYHEVIQARLVGLSYYLSSFWNIVDTMMCILLVPDVTLDLIHTFGNNSFDNYLIGLHSIIVFLFIVRLLSYFRGNDGFAFIIRLTFTVLFDTRYVLVFLLLFLLGFGLSAYTLQTNEYELNQGQLIYIFIKLTLGDIGSYDALKPEVSLLKYIYFLAASFILPIIIMNLMVAILTKSFENVSEKEESAKIFEKVDLLFEIDISEEAIAEKEKNVIFLFSEKQSELKEKGEFEYLQNELNRLLDNIEEKTNSHKDAKIVNAEFNEKIEDLNKMISEKKIYRF